MVEVAKSFAGTDGTFQAADRESFEKAAKISAGDGELDPTKAEILQRRRRR